MKYNFPLITHIDDVLPHIEGVKEFIVAEKDGYKVINYTVMGNDTFPDVDDLGSAIRRECRGLIFCSETGNILSRSYHKFFNAGERVETDNDNVDLSQDHVVLDKLDGSMVRPFYIPKYDIIRWGTKMGVTDVAMEAETFVASNPHYLEFAEMCIKNGVTPIFEWCSRKNMIVLDYPDDNLVLTGLRSTTSGDYMNFDMMESMAYFDYIPCVLRFTKSETDLAEWKKKVAAEKNTEGYVVRFDNGHMFKMKCEWYLQIHRAKDKVSNLRSLVALILNGDIDDVKSIVDRDHRDRIEQFEDELWTNINILVDDVFTEYSLAVNDGMSRKDFALSSENMSSLIRRYVFVLYNNDDLTDNELADMVIRDVLKNTGSNSALEKMGDLIPKYE